MARVMTRPTGYAVAEPATTTAVTLTALDPETGFTRALENRSRAIGWRFAALEEPPAAAELARMRLNALLVDPAPLGSRAWPYLEALCRDLPRVVLVVCTAPSSVAERVRGLRLGVDDWIAKPCHPEEALARVEAALRRMRTGDGLAHQPDVVDGELEVRPQMYEAFVGGRAVGLTRREFELLALLAAAHGQVLTRDAIYERVWGYAMPHGDRSVDVFVRKLRQKLARASSGWSYVHTHYGVGYRFRAERIAGDD